MSDPATTARTAREALSRGLNALQSDPSIPPSLVELAAPIAQSMGALHQIERTNGAQLLPHANVALENVRGALAKLQLDTSAHPAVAVAIESVASSLGLVHALSKLANPAPAQAAPIPLVQHAAPQQAPQQAAPVYQPPPQQAAPAYVQQQAPQQAYQQPPQQQQPHFPPPQAHQPAPQQHFQQRDPFAAPPQQGGGASPLAATAFAPAAAPQQAYGQPPAPVPSPGVGGGAAGDMPVFNADLGAQSTTNFYKGLSGNDIIDHGGLFVSTYMIPKIGTPVRLKISLPGGYEFEANAVVRWRREASESSGSDAPPGFGAQFTQITTEARQLVYRYVRNREPLFHDDL
jgi:hypothetical protein